MEEIVALTILVPLAILICLIVLFARGAGQRRQLAALRDEVDALRREVRNLRADATSFSASGRDNALIAPAASYPFITGICTSISTRS